jgi:hypothetical protein
LIQNFIREDSIIPRPPQSPNDRMPNHKHTLNDMLSTPHPTPGKSRKWRTSNEVTTGQPRTT